MPRTYGSGTYGYGSGRGGGTYADLGAANTLPTFLAEMNLSADMAGYFQIGVGVIGTDRIGGPYGVAQWTLIQQRLETFNISRGRQNELSGVTAGTVQMLLDDNDSAFDPDNTAGPYYGLLKVMRQFRVSAIWGNARYTLGYVFLDAMQPIQVAVNADVQLSGSDLFKRLNLQRRTTSFPQQRVDQRLNALLDLIQWPAGQRTIDPTGFLVPAISLSVTTTSQTLLSHIDSLMKATQADFFIGRDGNAVYHDLQRRLSMPSIGTFGAGGLPIRRMSAGLRDSFVLNDVHVKRTAGVEQIASDATSQANYDLRTYVLDPNAADQTLSDSQANSLANWILSQHAQPSQRVDTIELDGTANDSLWPLILGADIGDRITIQHSVPGTTGMIAQDYWVESIGHTWSPQNNPELLTTWGLRRAVPLNTYLQIGGPTVIGSGQLAY